MQQKLANRLTKFPGEARARGVDCIPYRTLREQAVNGLIPAHQRNNIWHFYEDDVDRIIAALAGNRENTGFGK